MKKALFILAISAACAFAACGDHGDGPKEEILARINDYELPLKVYETQLRQDLELKNDFKLTEGAKRDFLERMIRKELLIQEAVRLRLDREEDFVRAIERYWESTLIRSLMERKGREIMDRTVVTEEEIRARYEKIRRENPAAPGFDLVRDRIRKTLLEERRSAGLKAWIDGLKKAAHIEINYELLTARNR
ncbi:MAG: hypothetical protein JRF59_08325 [Deltaproteobacteria bacterium]|nr:hypothetical protein [Deltaproteobacteria bacterium]MBW1923924.1 hypothetical protein [Deltaproteobacteria bacterium]MBW1950280.1 hypothetical protein [Deltaproteobacteria bacterium]MBW2009007.1 hypothetical protein [Deltaproteobacteria bacterium]MBW2103380.1 hypothetical protein [Deltaproteobacteria bacterium]